MLTLVLLNLDLYLIENTVFKISWFLTKPADQELHCFLIRLKNMETFGSLYVSRITLIWCSMTRFDKHVSIARNYHNHRSMAP